MAFDKTQPYATVTTDAGYIYYLQSGILYNSWNLAASTVPPAPIDYSETLPNVEPTFVYQSTGTPGVTDETVNIRAFIAAAGVNAKLVFDPNVTHLVSGRLLPLDQQSWWYFTYKKAAQVFTNSDASLADGASSIHVVDITGFTVGSSILVQTVAETLIGTATRGEPVNFTLYPCDIDIITPDTPGATTGPGTLHVNYPFGITGGPLASGAVVCTSYPVIGNRREVDVATNAANTPTPYTRFGLFYMNGDGNYLLQKYTGWRTMSEVDMISDNMNIWQPVLNNYVGEGIVVGGSDVLIERPYLTNSIGNPLHFSAYSSKAGEGGGTGAKRVYVRGGYIANGNAAPAAWHIPSGIQPVTITIASPGVFTWPNAASQPINGDALMLTTTGALPTGLSANTYYFVVNTSGATFQVSATSGGAAINTSGSQSGTHTARLYALPKDKPGYSSPATDGRFSTAFGGLINAAINIGHRAGGVCISDFILDWEIDGLQVENCATGVGAIDTQGNSRGTIQNCLIRQCGYSDNTARQGAFGFGGNVSLGYPKQIILRNNRIFDCYPTNIGAASIDAAVQGAYPSIELSGNYWHNTPVTIQYCQIAAENETFSEPLGISAFPGDVLLAFLGTVKGKVDMTAVGGDISMSVSGAAGTYDLDFSGRLIDSYDCAIKCFGSANIPGFRINKTNITQAQTNDVFTPNSWSGIQAASGGGYATQINVPGPVDIRVSNSTRAGITGIRCQNTTGGDISAGNIFRNVSVHMASASQAPFLFTTGSTNLIKDCWLIDPSSYPEIDVTSWSPTIEIIGDTVLLPA